jgi:hypothetical protein
MAAEIYADTFSAKEIYKNNNIKNNNILKISSHSYNGNFIL